MKEITSPILLLAFNRPEKTQLVFDAIRAVKPQKLYVAIDAPREGREDDVENNNKVKTIVHNIDWKCDVHYLEQERNLGCSLSGVTAWNWLFEHEDRMIFVEDDGLATPSAFYFIEDMLLRYKDNEKIAYVGGVNYGQKYGVASYFFTRFVPATYFMGVWKRTQKLYEYDMLSYNKIKYTSSFRKNFRSVIEYLFLTNSFDSYIKSIKRGKRQNTYDVQMNYLVYKYGLYSIYPNVNMVSNIGLDGGANNHVDVNSEFYKKFGNRPRCEMPEIIHPDKIVVDDKFEKLLFNYRCLRDRGIVKSLVSLCYNRFFN